MTRPRFDAVLFDVGGVFVLPDPVSIGDVLEPWIGPAMPFHRFRRAHHLGLHALETDAIARDIVLSAEALDWSVFRRAYLADLGVPETGIEESLELLAGIWSPLLWRARIEDSIAGLWRLSTAGVPVGIISNASGQVPSMLAHQGICQIGPGAGARVVCIFDSALVGLSKPDSRLFGLGFDEMKDVVDGIQPHQVAYVGDSLINDVWGARDAGLTPLQLDPFGAYAGMDHERIASVREILPMCGVTV